MSGGGHPHRPSYASGSRASVRCSVFRPRAPTPRTRRRRFARSRKSACGCCHRKRRRRANRPSPRRQERDAKSGSRGLVTGRIDWTLAAAGRAAACRGVHAGGARGQTASIGAVLCYLVLRGATHSAAVVSAEKASRCEDSQSDLKGSHGSFEEVSNEGGDGCVCVPDSVAPCYSGPAGTA